LALGRDLWQSDEKWSRDAKGNVHSLGVERETNRLLAYLDAYRGRHGGRKRDLKLFDECKELAEEIYERGSASKQRSVTYEEALGLVRSTVRLVRQMQSLTGLRPYDGNMQWVAVTDEEKGE